MLQNVPLACATWRKNRKTCFAHALHMQIVPVQSFAASQLRSFALNLVSSFGFLQGQKEKKAYEQFLREREEEARTPLDSAGLR